MCQRDVEENEVIRGEPETFPLRRVFGAAFSRTLMEKCTTSLASKNASALVRPTGAGGDIAGRKPSQPKQGRSKFLFLNVN